MMQITTIGLLTFIPLLSQERWLNPNAQALKPQALKPQALKPQVLKQGVQEGQGGQVLRAATDTPEVTTASPEELQALLRYFGSAMKSEQAAKVIEALQRMEWHDNAELLVPAKTAIQYKATKKDKAAVAEEADTLGISKRSKIKEMVIELESEVQAGAARVLASIPGKDSIALLMKTLKRKDVKKERPATLASVIVALGNLGHEPAAEFVERELKQARHPLTARASVRYFGQIKSKDLKVIRILISMLDAPEPANVDGAANPPASFWEARWKIWLQTRRDVVWTLREITGKTWNPTDGDQASDSARALKFVEDNAKRLGFK